MVLLLVSFVHVLATDRVAGFRTSVWMSWLRPIALLTLMLAYVLGERWETRKNSEKTQINRVEPIQRYSKVNRNIAWSSVGVLVTLVLLGIVGWGFDWFNSYEFLDFYWITFIGCVHMLWLCSVIAMALDKAAKRWQRMLSIIAPIQINALLVIYLELEVVVPRQMLDSLPSWMTEDIPIILLVIALLFLVAVWLINTIQVLRVENLASKQQLLTNLSEEK